MGRANWCEYCGIGYTDENQPERSFCGGCEYYYCEDDCLHSHSTDGFCNKKILENKLERERRHEGA
jgi:hypothetical protein